MNRSSDRFGADRRPRPDRAEAVMADKEQPFNYRVTGVLPPRVLAVVIGDRLSKDERTEFFQVLLLSTAQIAIYCVLQWRQGSITYWGNQPKSD